MNLFHHITFSKAEKLTIQSLTNPSFLSLTPFHSPLTATSVKSSFNLTLLLLSSIIFFVSVRVGHLLTLEVALEWAVTKGWCGGNFSNANCFPFGSCFKTIHYLIEPSNSDLNHRRNVRCENKMNEMQETLQLARHSPWLENKTMDGTTQIIARTIRTKKSYRSHAGVKLTHKSCVTQEMTVLYFPTEAFFFFTKVETDEA